MTDQRSHVLDHILEEARFTLEKQWSQIDAIDNKLQVTAGFIGVFGSITTGVIFNSQPEQTVLLVFLEVSSVAFGLLALVFAGQGFWPSQWEGGPQSLWLQDYYIEKKKDRWAVHPDSKYPIEIVIRDSYQTAIDLNRPVLEKKIGLYEDVAMLTALMMFTSVLTLITLSFR